MAPLLVFTGALDLMIEGGMWIHRHILNSHNNIQEFSTQSSISHSIFPSVLEQAFQKSPVWAHLFHFDTIFSNNQCFHNKSSSAVSPDGWFFPHRYKSSRAHGDSPLGLLQLRFLTILGLFLYFLPILLGLNSCYAILQSLLAPRNNSPHVPLGALVSLQFTSWQHHLP